MAPNTNDEQVMTPSKGGVFEPSADSDARANTPVKEIYSDLPTDFAYHQHYHQHDDEEYELKFITWSEFKELYQKWKNEIVWRNVILMGLLHSMFPPALFLFLFVVQWKTFFFTWALLYVGGFGITAGAHRLWAHRSYKAKLPLRLFLTFCQTMALQNDIYEWCRDHRVHHKYSETDADPHNSKRGFFFSHIGWLLVKKHPDVKRKGKQVDMGDLMEDPVIYYQRKFYVPLVILIAMIFPAWVPIYFWGERPLYAIVVTSFGRLCFSLNCTWLVNSAAHMWGNKPYDKVISAVENFRVSQWVLGEGWHNYHHTFPWDYKTSELGLYQFNLTALFIDFMAKIGQAYDLRTVEHETIMKRVTRTGDESTTFMRLAEEEEQATETGTKKID